jgi:hypothetical protein
MDASRVTSMISARKLIAFICFAAVLLAAMTPASAGLFPAVLLPFLYIVGLVTIAWAKRQSEENQIPASSCLRVTASRARPIGDPLT